MFATRITEDENENMTDRGKEYFVRIKESASRMQVLIQDLLAYSRTNTTERKFEVTDLKMLIEDIKSDFREELELKHATIEIGNMCVAQVIPFQFRQLLQNLLTNALKFGRPDVPPHIRIRSEIVESPQVASNLPKPGEKYCHITFSDNGIGFEPQYSERIFQMFQRLHSRTAYEGTGIGLTIVKKIVDNHNGLISATSKLGEGATFDIYIPAHSA